MLNVAYNEIRQLSFMFSLSFPFLADLGNDLNVELSRVVSELEQAIGDHQQQLNLDSPVSPPLPLLADSLHHKSDQVGYF